MDAETKTAKNAAGETAGMAKRLATGVEQSKAMAYKSLNRFKNSSRFVWHTYLGTAATMEETAVDFAKTMAKKGGSVEANAKERINSRLAKAKAAKEKFGTKLNEMSSARVARVEKAVSAGLNKSLHAVGVPTKGDMDELALLMNDMSKSIEALAPVKTAKRSSSRTSAGA